MTTTQPLGSLAATMVIRGARNASNEPVEIGIADGRIVEVSSLNSPEVVQADGLLVLPGLVDLHTHLREPGFESSETIATGTKAAARGGYTAVFAMANLDPVTDTVEAVEHIRQIAARESYAQVFPVGSITCNLAGERLSAIEQMAGAGVTVFSDDGRCVMNAQLMRQALQLGAAKNVVIAQHSQDHDLAPAQACADERSIAEDLGLPGWPWAAEASIIARDAQLAELTDATLYCCHVTTAESVEVIRWAKARGIKVVAEVTPHHLLLSSHELRSGNTTFKVNPPLRGMEDVIALRDALADGTIDTVGTDHAPHDRSAKDAAFPDAKPGMIGLEQSLGVVIETMIASQRLSWEDLTRVMSRTPARIGRACGHGTALQPGDRANLILVDPVRRAVVDAEQSYSKARNNPYDGLDLPDPVMMTVCEGVVTYRNMS